jgi:hypothetical protein
LLRHFEVSHILIHRRRLYDRSKEGSHYGGFPREFLAAARDAPYLEKAYENPAVIIYRVRLTDEDPVASEEPAGEDAAAP